MDTTPITGRPAVEEIESLCMSCHQNGTTRLLLTRIPFFREVLLSSFSCPHCHLQNSEIQSAGEIQQRGIKITFCASSLQDLQRQIVKGDNCVVRIEELDLEIPKGRGQLTNLEGLLQMVKADLEVGQDVRKDADERVWQAVQGVINGIASIVGGTRFPLTLTLDDPTGNSTLEPSPADTAGKYKREQYPRTSTQNAALGLGDGDSSIQPNGHIDDGTAAPPPSLRPQYSAASSLFPAPNTASQDDDDDAAEIEENRIYTFPTPCPGCSTPTTTNMKLVRIPHFASVVIMATTCASCGYRSNEVKSGGPVPDRGRIIRLRVERPEDLSRDILKSESCNLAVAELGLNVETGTLGGRFTTVEGLLAQVRDDLKSAIFDAASDDGDTDGMMTLAAGDSMPATARAKWADFFARLDAAIAAEEAALPFTVEMRDPLAASYVQSLRAPEADAQIEAVEYERSAEEEEELGLRDMRVEGYEGEPGREEGAAKTGEEGNGEGGGEEVDGGVDVGEVQRAVEERMKALAED